MRKIKFFFIIFSYLLLLRSIFSYRFSTFRRPTKWEIGLYKSIGVNRMGNIGGFLGGVAGAQPKSPKAWKTKRDRAKNEEEKPKPKPKAKTKPNKTLWVISIKIAVGVCFLEGGRGGGEGAGLGRKEGFFWGCQPFFLFCCTTQILQEQATQRREDQRDQPRKPKKTEGKKKKKTKNLFGQCVRRLCLCVSCILTRILSVCEYLYLPTRKCTCVGHKENSLNWPWQKE